MAPKAPRRQVVDVQDILTSICTKWGLLVLYELSKGAKRHGELRRAISGVSQKMLTQTLRTLERDRLVQRTIYPIVPPRVDYALTPLGKTLMPPLSALYLWTERTSKRSSRLAANRRRRRGLPNRTETPSGKSPAPTTYSTEGRPRSRRKGRSPRRRRSSDLGRAREGQRASAVLDDRIRLQRDLLRAAQCWCAS
jgi:DNA-binding HxlR family transcriptional regulator